jgi:hypothetical protein
LAVSTLELSNAVSEDGLRLRCQKDGLRTLFVDFFASVITLSLTRRERSGNQAVDSAQAAAPPKPKRYFRPIILWGPVVVFFGMWTYVGFNTLFMHPKAFVLKEFLAVVFFLLFIAALARLLVNLGRVTRYNREVYDQLFSDWAHTFMCRRCGKYSLIRP